MFIPKELGSLNVAGAVRNAAKEYSALEKSYIGGIEVSKSMSQSPSILSDSIL